jgi:hypothetical protein
MSTKAILLLFFLPAFSFAQSRMDTIGQVRNTLKWYDLDFTEPETDSLIGNLNNYLMLYKGMHRTLPANDIPFPFAFKPAPASMKISTRKEKIFWDIPANINLPANKE